MPGSSAPPGGAIRRTLTSPGARKSLMAMLDQSLVSGTRLVMTVLIGRYAGAEELGIYAICFAGLLLTSVAQESLLSAPYAVLGPRYTQEARRRFAGNTLVTGLVFGIALSAALLLATALPVVASLNTQAALFPVLAATVPLFLLQGLLRRLSMAHLRIDQALIVDGTVSVVLFGAIVALIGQGTFSALTALGATGAACLAGALCGLILNREQIGFGARTLLPQLARNWRFGRWILGAQQVSTVSNNLVIWLLPVFAGAAASGVYAACNLVVTAANPLLLGLGNVLEPRTARALVDDGRNALIRVVRKVTLLTLLAVGVYVVFVLVFGEWIIAWLFDAGEFEALGHPLAVLALALLIRSIRLGRNHALRALGAPHWNFIASLVELGTIAACALALLTGSGVLGAAYSVLCGSVTGSLVRFVAYHRTLGKLT